MFGLPRTLTLPGGARVSLRATGRADAGAARPGAELFDDVLRLFDEGAVTLVREGKDVDVRDLALADFHVVRAFLAKAGLVADEEVEVDCHNCGEILFARPCEGLETGPWEDGELGDEELDATGPFGTPIPIEPIAVGRVRRARDVTLAPRTVREAAPLFAALARDPIDLDERFVQAMGIVRLGDLDDPRRIAAALSACGDDAFSSVTDAFLDAHYPLRLARDVFCPSCKARNTIDAPGDRELERGLPLDRGAPEAGGLPPLETFVEVAHAIAEPLIAAMPGDKPELVVEDGTPAVDDGGEPLLGSYLPPPPKDAPVPTRPPTVTVYYRTFERMEHEEGPYDWEAELRETIEHELEHHLYFLRGDDPMDEEERAEIAREATRIVGAREATRRTLAVFGHSIPDFFARAWPLVLVAAVVFAITLAEGRCTD